MNFIANGARQGKPCTFAQAFDPKNNAFAFLRLTLAVVVIVSHCFPLGGFGRDPLAIIAGERHTMGLVAVGMFFVLSGFLISRSALQSRSVGRFLWHRFLRIFPGYWVCLLVCAFVFAPLFALQEHGVLLRVFSAPWDPPQSYLIHNAAMFHLNEFSISGVMNLHPASIAHLLSHNPSPWLINGSLWSLPYECACYLAVGGLAFSGALRRGRFIVLVLFVGFWALYGFSCLDPKGFDQSFPCRGFGVLVMLGVYFLAGCVCFLYRERIRFSTGFFGAALIVLCSGLTLKSFSLVAPIAMTYVFLWLAFTLPIKHFDAKGDFSYGTYIYAFPVQQGLALLHLQERGFYLYLTCSLVITGILAILSYRWIEGPCLKYKHLDVAATFLKKPKPAWGAQATESCPARDSLLTISDGHSAVADYPDSLIAAQILREEGHVVRMRVTQARQEV